MLAKRPADAPSHPHVHARVARVARVACVASVWHAWRLCGVCVAWRGVAWRGEAWRGVAWRAPSRPPYEEALTRTFARSPRILASSRQPATRGYARQFQCPSQVAGGMDDFPSSKISAVSKQYELSAPLHVLEIPRERGTLLMFASLASGFWTSNSTATSNFRAAGIAPTATRLSSQRQVQKPRCAPVARSTLDEVFAGTVSARWRSAFAVGCFRYRTLEGASPKAPSRSRNQGLVLFADTVVASLEGRSQRCPPLPRSLHTSKQ